MGVTLVRAHGSRRGCDRGRHRALAGDPGGGLVIMPDVFTGRHRALIYALAARHKVPTIYGPRYHAAAGG